MERLVRLTESDLHRIIRESVNRVLNEYGDASHTRYQKGRVFGRQAANGNFDDRERFDLNDPDIFQGMKDETLYQAKKMLRRSDTDDFKSYIRDKYLRKKYGGGASLDDVHGEVE